MAELIAGMFNASPYKKSQGKMARQITFAAMAIAVVVGAWKLSDQNAGTSILSQYGLPCGLLAVGAWICYRIVNIPRFADFLISVEAEMNKVQWPGRSELWRATVVVIAVIFFLAAMLFVYDLVLQTFFDKVFGF